MTNARRIAALVMFAWPITVVHAAPPNVVVFLVDDMGWQDTSVPFWSDVTPQNRHFHTPNMERLASQGMKFTQAYACTVCSPTRTSLMTGQNAARHGVTNWTLYADRETSHMTPSLRAPNNWRREGLQPPARTLPRLLQQQMGFRTIHVGKAHWGAVDTPGSNPQALGFDVNIAGHAAGSPGHYHGQKNYGNRTRNAYTPPRGVPSLEAYHETSTHLTDALTLEANRSITDAVQHEQPFYLYLAHYAVHTPIQPHAEYVGRYAGETYDQTDLRIPETEVNYASMIEGMDASLGSLLATLEDLSVAEETLIVFLSDNGGLSRLKRDTSPRGTGKDTHCWPLREGKGSAYEGGTRIPMIVAWAKPDANNSLQQSLPIKPGSVSAAPVIVEDLVPAVLNWVGGTELLNKLGETDGIDFTPALVGRESHLAEARARPLVFHYPHQWYGQVEGGYQPHSAMRQDGWKVIFFYEGQRWELYNLDDDIGEINNLASERPEILNRMARTLEAELTRMGARWPVNRHSGHPETLRVPAEIGYPDGQWSTISPAEAGLSLSRLRDLSDYLGGRGMVTYDGQEVFHWGDVTTPGDVASAAKPVLTHLLIEAVENGLLTGFEEPLAKYRPALAVLNPHLDHKDQGITFRHCANQISCYGVTESPGQAYDYNDFQMALFVDTLVENVHGSSMTQVDKNVLRPLLTQVIGCQDKPSMLAFGDRDRAGRLRISPRDFCRFGLLYLHDGNWRGKQVIAPAYARTVTHSPLPLSLPRTQGQAADMLPGQRSIGSDRIPDDQTDHLGCYSWLWWVNGKRQSGRRLWPDAPADVYACLGHKHGKRGLAVIPGWRIVISWNDTRLDEYAWENQEVDAHPLNEAFKLLRPIE